jgi:hypothetical protein
MQLIHTRPGRDSLRSAEPSFDTAVVIADRGDTAWVVVLEGPEPVSVGRRFRFQDQVWEIVRPRTRTRTFVAEPVRS